MNEQSVRRLRGRVVGDIPRDPDQLAVFAEAFSEAVGQTVYPGSLRMHCQEVVKFNPGSVVNVGVQRRMVIPAKLNQYPVLISHRVPARPPLTQKILVFSDVNLFQHLELEENMPVRLDIDRRYLGRAHIIDWARSLSNVLDGGIGR